jgi:hypothetical protein
MPSCVSLHRVAVWRSQAPSCDCQQRALSLDGEWDVGTIASLYRDNKAHMAFNSNDAGVKYLST